MIKANRMILEALRQMCQTCAGAKQRSRAARERDRQAYHRVVAKTGVYVPREAK
jgi:hypothetical protein